MARKILLADDSVTAQNMGRKILTDAGYEVMTVNNGSAALKRIGEQKPDLIVLDVYMPGYSGLEVCQRLKDSRETSRIPILLTVGKLEPFKPDDARRVAADAFIIKPFEASELLSALTRLEDQIVPQGDTSKVSSRFAAKTFAADSSSDSKPFDAGEQGWKSRLRFPAKKTKQEETEAEPDYVSPSAFHEFREKAGEKAAQQKAVHDARSARQEPAPVPDIPRDITPDELDALSALAAKLDSHVPQHAGSSVAGDEASRVMPERKAEISESNADGHKAAPQAIDSADELPPQAEASQVRESKTKPIEADAVQSSVETSDKTPAAVDREDEPFFATVADAGTSGSNESESDKPPASMSAASSSQESSAPQSGQTTEAQQSEGAKNRGKAEEMVAEAVAEQAIAEHAAAEGRVPTDEELAEALRLLTPVHGTPSAEAQGSGTNEQSGVPSNSADQSEAGQSGNGAAWHAVPVDLSSEEMSLSLEAEMFRAVVPEPTTAAAPTGVEAPAAPDAGTSMRENTKGPDSETRHSEAVSPSSAESAAKDTVPTSSSYAIVDPASQDPVQSGSQQMQEHASVTEDALEKDEQATGDQESMSKHRTSESKASKSGWHQIHAATPTANTDVETAKHTEGEPAAEESLKAMAAAAAGNEAPPAAGETDPNAIASIVDSVLADLRPRIVEEIAKKLAKK